MDDIIKNEIFGKVTAYLSVIEFQKRGAPHSHSLFWLEDFNLTVKNIDNIVSAEYHQKTVHSMYWLKNI